jgi:hypothetical protein
MPGDGRAGQGPDFRPTPVAKSGQFVEQRLGFFQVLRPEALGEPGVDGREQFVGLADALLVPQEPGVASGGPQLPGF